MLNYCIKKEFFVYNNWIYSHTNSQGYRVNSQGYDENGIYRGAFDSNTFIGGFLIALLVIALMIIEKINNFIESNYLFIEMFLGFFIILSIIYYIRVKKSRKKAFKIILISILVFFSLFSSYPIKKEDAINLFKKSSNVSNELPEKIYAVVVSDSLNIRSGPSINNEVLGQLARDTFIEIIDNTNHWWKVKSEDIEGFVNSDYLQLKKNND